MQLGRHFWPDWSSVMGVRVDYLAPTIYLIDMLWVGLVITNFKYLISNHACRQAGVKLRKTFKNKWFWGILIFVMVNILVAVNKEVAVIRWLRIGEWITLILLVKSQKLKIKSYLKTIIPIWVVVEVGLGIAQVVNGSSVGGIFYWLGERSFNTYTPGIATMTLFGNEILRAYGTFSHPNSMAGFLLVTILLWKIVTSQKSKVKSRKLISWLVWIVGLIGIMICGSRVVWLLTAGIMIYELRFMNKKFQISFYGILVGLSGWILYQGYLAGWDSEGISKRIDLMSAAVEMWKQSPIVGVGLQNFLVKLPEFRNTGGIFWLQPVHNIPLLWLSEIGLVGILLLIKRFMMHEVRNMNKTVVWIWVIIGVTSLFDHYWWTLPQNWWLLGLVIAILG